MNRLSIENKEYALHILNRLRILLEHREFIEQAQDSDDIHMHFSGHPDLEILGDVDPYYGLCSFLECNGRQTDLPPEYVNGISTVVRTISLLYILDGRPVPHTDMPDSSGEGFITYPVRGIDGFNSKESYSLYYNADKNMFGCSEYGRNRWAFAQYMVDKIVENYGE